MQFSEWLYNKRTENGYTLQELADRIGSGKSQVWELEHGQDPKLSTLEKVAKAFGLETWRMLKQLDVKNERY